MAEIGRRRLLVGAGTLAASGVAAATGYLAARGESAVSAPPLGVPVVATEVLVAGGGLGGVAAAYAALRAGRRVVLTDRSYWIGGQASAQAVPADEHPWVEVGSARAYRDLRRRVVDDFRRDPAVLDRVGSSTGKLNPGRGHSPLSVLPKALYTTVMEMLGPYLGSGRLRLQTRCRPTSAQVHDRLIRSVTFSSVSDDTPIVTVEPQMVVEGSDLGDLLPVLGLDFALGLEQGKGRGGTGEMHNPADEPHPECQQAHTMVVALGYGANHMGHPLRSEGYRWLRRKFTPLAESATTVFDPTGTRDEKPGVMNIWDYRRVQFGGYFRDRGVGDICALNFHAGDVAHPTLIPPGGETSEEWLRERVVTATSVTLAAAQYFQTEYPRRDGSGRGYADLYPVPAATGTSTGFAQFPYVREARRMITELVLSEKHMGVEELEAAGRRTAVRFPDTVGLVAGPLDIHDNNIWPNGMQIAARPFTLPLRALVPAAGPRNLLAGGKTAGATHLANGALRLHVNEWAVGEAAGWTAAWAVANARPVRALLRDAAAWRAFSARLERAGVPLRWPADIARQQLG